MEGRLRRRRPARAGRHRGRRTDLRQLPDLLPLPREGLRLDEDSALHRRTYDAIAAAYDGRQAAELPPFLAEPLAWLVEAVPPGGLVVDLGCGPGREVERLASWGLGAVGVDLSTGMLAVAAQRAPGRVVTGDLRSVPLRDGSCDGVWSSYALLHLSDADLAIALGEVRRVLRPGGTAVLVLASQGGGCEQVAYAPEHARVFHVRDERALTASCQNAGLRVVRSDTLPEAWRSPVRVLVERPVLR